MKQFTDDEIDSIVAVYHQLGSGTKAAKKLRMSKNTLYRVLKERGIDLYRVRGSRLESKGITPKDIIDAYQRLGSGIDVAKELGISDRTVYDILFYNNIKTDGLERYRDRIRVLDDDAKRDIFIRYDAGTPVRHLASEYGVTASAIDGILKKHGRHTPRSPRLSKKEKKEIADMYADGMTYKQISEKTGRSESTMIKYIHESHPDIARPKGSKGEKSNIWNGGKHVHRGYVMEYVSDDDPMRCMAHKARPYVPEHRLVMARAFGRPLESYETVHHINGITTDNRLENLQLRIGQHGRGVRMQCLDCGSHNVSAVELP